jgi:hypothetical protein
MANNDGKKREREEREKCAHDRIRREAGDY